MESIVNVQITGEILPKGLCSTAVRVKLSAPADNLDESAWKVTGRSVTGIEQDGDTVILHIAPEKAYCMIGKDGKEIVRGPRPPKDKEQPPKEGERPGNGPRPDMGYMALKQLNLAVETPYGAVNATELVCDEFDKFQYCSYGDFQYALYVPENYDPSISYPLVMFIPDASGRGVDPRVPLMQGIGGVIWSRDEVQKENPCFVLCPLFMPDEILTQDDFSFHPKLLKVKDLIDEVCAKYSIDKGRIYGTGQSMGCMSNCQLDISYPELFAAQILVAGQWDPDGTGKALVGRPVWILVSDHDLKAHPGMDAVTEALEKHGGSVARFVWDAKAEDKWDEYFDDALSKDANCRYTIFDGDSVVPEGEPCNGGTNHMSTWQVVYRMKRLRDWLFLQKK
jgi:predicted peptidase